VQVLGTAVRIFSDCNVWAALRALGTPASPIVLFRIIQV